jgi:DNA-damage-inducible protein J
MAVVSVRLDDKTKKQLDTFCKKVGLNTSTLIKMFATKTVREQRIPFDVEVDPFFEPSNIEELERRIKNIENGVNCHEHELIEA